MNVFFTLALLTIACALIVNGSPWIALCVAVAGTLGLLCRDALDDEQEKEEL